ncbi:MULTISPECIES: hypothetical protein [unclassified Roseitalea]|uniref:hypothetical protein n=1 Tax=unclassified Roseitalea TaxID=2639107 RepID=UPI00274008E7|nr:MULTISPECIES: hypothetical protein [unclassified Roseitalea]
MLASIDGLLGVQPMLSHLRFGWISSRCLGATAVALAVLIQLAQAAPFRAEPAHGRPHLAAFPATPFSALDWNTQMSVLDVPSEDCGKRTDVLIEAYIRQHPHFSGAQDDAEWRRTWLEDIGLTTYVVVLGCHFANPILDRLYPLPLEWLDINSGLPVWCGRWSGRVVDPELRQIVKEMIPLVMRYEVPRLVDTVIGATQQHRELGLDAFFALNPDVALYLVERRTRLFAEGAAVREFTFGDRETSDGLFLKSIPRQRRAAVMAAVETGDYQSILDTTAECMTREAFLDSVGAR